MPNPKRKWQILILTSFSRSPGGYTSYTKTLTDFLKRRGIECDWLSPEAIRHISSLLRASRRSRSSARSAGNRKSRIVQTAIWLLKVLGSIVLLRIAATCRKDSLTKVIGMDALAAIAVKPDLLVVHGAYANEIRSRIPGRLPFALALRLEVSAYRRARRIVAVDLFLQQRISNLTNLSSTLVPNPVRLDLFTMVDRKVAKDRLGFPTDRRLIVFMGMTPERYADHIPVWQRDLEALGFLTIRVGSPEIPYERMPLYYNAADIVVSMSTFPAYQRAAIESLACGTPIISNNSPLAYYASPEHLVETIKTFRCPDTREQMRNKVLGFDENAICTRLLALSIGREM